MAITIYGIKNCDTMKKAWTWLDDKGVAYQFHDYKKAGIDRDTLTGWVDKLGWEVLLNRAGTTFKKLPDAAKADIDRDRAIALMLEKPTLIKRPVLERDGLIEIGFSPDRYAQLFGG